MPKLIATNEEIDLCVELMKRHGDVYTTDTMQKAFSVESFLAPLVIVTRKSDGVRGTLQFTHRPRFYYDFQEGV